MSGRDSSPPSTNNHPAPGRSPSESPGLCGRPVVSGRTPSRPPARRGYIRPEEHRCPPGATTCRPGAARPLPPCRVPILDTDYPETASRAEDLTRPLAASATPCCRSFLRDPSQRGRITCSVGSASRVRDGRVHGCRIDGCGKADSMILSTNNIKSELSYAYLHAVAARGLECAAAGQHSDGGRGRRDSQWAKERRARLDLHRLHRRGPAQGDQHRAHDRRPRPLLVLAGAGPLQQAAEPGNPCSGAPRRAVFRRRDELACHSTESPCRPGRCLLDQPVGAPTSLNATGQTVYIPGRITSRWRPSAP